MKNEKGAKKIVRGEQGREYGKDQGARGLNMKGAKSIDPLSEAH